MNKLLSAGSSESTVCLRYAHLWERRTEDWVEGFLALADFEMGTACGL